MEVVQVLGAHGTLVVNEALMCILTPQEVQDLVQVERCSMRYSFVDAFGHVASLPTPSDISSPRTPSDIS